jgi:hypothetical protein
VAKQNDLVHRCLGPKAKVATFTIGKRVIAGHRAVTKLEPDEVEPLSIDAAKYGLAVFRTTTKTYELFAVPDASPTEIVELTRVGTHNDSEDWKRVRATIGKVHARAPFDVVLADAAGLIGVFRDKLAKAKAKALAKLIAEELPAALGAMLGDASDLEVEDEDLDDDLSPEDEDARRGFSAVFARYLQERGRFHLWWD